MATFPTTNPVHRQDPGHGSPDGKQVRRDRIIGIVVLAILTALMVLMIWLGASIVMLPDLGYATVSKWLGAPIPATAMVLLVISTFWHARLGLQVLIEDYIHDAGLKFGVVALLNLSAIGGGAFGIFSVLRLALSSASVGAA